MKLYAYAADNKHELTLSETDGRVVARIGEREYELGVNELSAGGFLLSDGDEIFECLVATRSGDRNAFEVHLRGATYEVGIEDPKRLRSGVAGAGHDHGEARITAAMPGKVVRVLVETGQRVEAGAGVVVVEAMKMQNEMKSPKAGTVITLNALPGATVNAGDLLAVIE